MAGTSHTTRARLPRTGQTIVATTNDDGTYQKGVKTTPRWVDNSDGTISDRYTGLMWPKNPSKMIPGATGVTSDNLGTNARSNWLNNTSYTAGDLVNNSNTGVKYFCAVNHTSRTRPVDWATSTSYTNEIVRDPANNSYWECISTHTSSTAAPAWSAMTSYYTNDIIEVPGNQWAIIQSDFTSISTPSAWSSSGYYYVDDMIEKDGFYYKCSVEHQAGSYIAYWSSYTYYYVGDWVLAQVNGIDWWYCQCTTEHTASDNFDNDLAGGNWSQVTQDQFLAEFSKGAWANFGSNLFDLEYDVNSAYYSTFYLSQFYAERIVHNELWQSATDTYTMAYDISDHPTYWRAASVFTINATTFASQYSATFANGITACEGLDFAGYTDWRMPNINELLSLWDWVNTNSSQAFLDPLFTAFVITTANYYSSTTNPKNSFALGTYSTNGQMIMNALNKGNTYYVLPVRGG